MSRRTLIKNYTRRDFIGTGAASAIAITYLPSRVFGANERLAMAGIGVGGKGSSDIDGAGTQGDVVAICDVDEKRLNGKGNKFKKAKKFFDYRAMLEKMGKSIDAVTVSTPDHNHAPAAIRAMRMGKHVYVQKPLTHTVWEARQMRLEAKKNKVCTQMGNQGTASSGLREGAEVIQSGVLGDLKEVHVWTNRPVWPQAPRITERAKDKPPVPEHLHWESFIGPAPMRPYHGAYHPFKWRGWWDFGTGALGDMACHTANLAYMGVLNQQQPTWVEPITVGPINSETYPGWAIIKMKFPAIKGRGPIDFHWYEGKEEGKKKLPPAELFHGERPANSGSLVVGSKGVLYSPDDYGAKWILLPGKAYGLGLRDDEEIKPRQHVPRWEGRIAPSTQIVKKGGPKKPERIMARNNGGDTGMKREWAQAIKENKPELALSNFDYAGNFTEAILMGNIAMKVGEGFDWNPEKLSSSNKKVAALITKEYRKGWEI